jgi:hypothetical protein
MMDPFSITAGVVDIVAPALHCVRRLLDDLQAIIDALDTVKSEDDLVLAPSVAALLFQISATYLWVTG